MTTNTNQPLFPIPPCPSRPTDKHQPTNIKQTKAKPEKTHLTQHAKN